MGKTKFLSSLYNVKSVKKAPTKKTMPKKTPVKEAVKNRKK